MSQKKIIRAEKEGPGPTCWIDDPKPAEFLWALPADEIAECSLDDGLDDVCRRVVHATCLFHGGFALNLCVMRWRETNLPEKLLVDISKYFDRYHREGVRRGGVVKVVDDLLKGLVIDLQLQ